MWRRIITAGTVAALGWTPVIWAAPVVEEQVIVNGAAQLPADPIPPEKMSASQSEVLFQGNLQEAIELQNGTPPVPADGGTIQDTADYDALMSALIAQIDGEISIANANADSLNALLDSLEQSGGEGRGSTASEDPEGNPQGQGIESGDGYSYTAAVNPAPTVEVAQQMVQPQAPAQPPPIVGTAMGPTTPAAIQTMLRGRLPTLRDQLQALRLSQTNLVAVQNRALDLFRRGAVSRADRDHAVAMVQWINRRVDRVNALIAIANAAQGDVATLVGQFNGQVMVRLAGRVTALQDQERALNREIVRINGLLQQQAAAREDLDRLQVQLGLVRADLAQARQDVADGQATVTAGGIVLNDWDPAPAR